VASRRDGLTHVIRPGYAVRGVDAPRSPCRAAELMTKVRESVTIDWMLKYYARMKIKIIVKRILRFYDYPSDLRDETVQAVLLQAETLCKDRAA
jgi:type I restriction enzyme R subunit